MIRILLFLLITFVAVPANAEEAFDYDAFGRLPLQHDGRIKPIDTMARAYLKNFSGSENLHGASASEWLAQTLFDPAGAMGQPLFRILRPQILDLPERDGKRYSFTEIAPALSKKAEIIENLAQVEPRQWSEDQRELMRLQEQSILYMQLLRSFSMVLPLDIAIPKSLAMAWKIDTSRPLTFDAISQFGGKLDAKMKDILRRKGDNPDRYSEAEKEIAAFAYSIQTIRDGGTNNVLFRVIPSVWKDSHGTWDAPWSVGNKGTGSPESARILAAWEEAAQAYLQRKPAEFGQSMQILAQEYTPYIYKSRLEAEFAYNKYHPLPIAMAGYLLAFFACVAAALRYSRALQNLGVGILTAAGTVHGIAIGTRIFILERPPVGTLYESILFVGAVCTVIALLMELRRKDGLGLLVGSIMGLVLLFIAQAFDGEDTMKMLVAVLNTNFWLATHVLCITTGYGLCLITSGMAHIHLLRASYNWNRDTLLPAIKIMGLLALLFTATGTILGGIWADQSWGRFWGWDPKENGALLIVLWLVWIYHGHLSGHLKHLALAASMASLSIVVAIAWFGVNLLNVGLHSYGFITGVAVSLGAFCAVEAAVIGSMWWRAHIRKGAA